MKVDINEIFDSIQGEGRFAGHPAVFIRFAGCSNGCAFCDTKHANIKSPEYRLQKKDLHEFMTDKYPEQWCSAELQEVYEYVADLIEQSSTDRAKRIQMVVITGGEPFEQPEALGELCVKLPYLAHPEHGVTDYVQVCIESSGAVPAASNKNLPGLMNYLASEETEHVFLTVSPKPVGVQIEYIFAASQLKFLVGDTPKDDIPVPLEVFKHVQGRCEGITFQPIWYEGDEQRTQQAIQHAIRKAYIYGGTVSTQIHKFLGIR